MSKEFKKHLKKWNRWRKSNLNGKIHKLLVLIKVVNSPTFYSMNCNDLNSSKKKVK